MDRQAVSVTAFAEAGVMSLLLLAVVVVVGGVWRGRGRAREVGRRWRRWRRERARDGCRERESNGWVFYLERMETWHFFGQGWGKWHVGVLYMGHFQYKHGAFPAASRGVFLLTFVFCLAGPFLAQACCCERRE